MDKNKEFLTGEPATEAAPITDTDNTAAEATAEETAVPADAAAKDAAEAAAEEAPAPAPKKKKTLQTTILISIIIVVCVLLAAVVCRLFFWKGVVNTNLLGAKTTTTWHYRPDTAQLGASVDEAMVPDYYFNFQPDGTITVNIGTLSFQGDYTLRNLEEGEGTAKAGTPVLEIAGTGQIDGTFLYDREGNLFSGNTLKLTSLANSEANVTLDAKDYTPVTLEPSADFAADDTLTGNWSYKNEKLTQNFTFNSNGTYELKTVSGGVIEKQTGIYTAKDGTLTLTYKYPNEQSQTLKYTVKDDKLSLIQVINVYGQTYEQPLYDFTREK